MKLGFIVNPIAGMGGKVGLKGTDSVLREAIVKGAEPIAPKRAVEFLQKLKKNSVGKTLRLWTCPGTMGEEEAKATSLTAQVLSMRIGKETSAGDTKTAVKLLIKASVDLIVFVGGDGTARDVFDAMHGCKEVPVLGFRLE